MYNKFLVRFEQAMKESAAGSAVEPYLEMVKGAEAAMKRMDEQENAPRQNSAMMDRMEAWMEEETRRGTVETFVEPAEAAAHAAEVV